MHRFTERTGGVTAAKGYRACAVHAGIRYQRNDLALLVSDRPASVAGVFTANRVQAAPVRLDRERVAGGRAQALIVNSGNANACTGEQGMRDALAMSRALAGELDIPEALTLVCSTGVIGVPMPMDRVLAGIPTAVAALSPDGGDAAAKAIMTTDTVDKQVALSFPLGDGEATIGAMAKGSGMIEPNMATMLAFITTDAAAPPSSLAQALHEAVDASFNRITVDGDCSTNDTVLVFANGARGGPELTPAHPDWPGFRDALSTVCLRLARMIVQDGEGASRLVTVRVSGAASDADAERAARAVAKSPLVKTSWFGGDPNWGRVIAAVGYSGASMDEARTRIGYDGVMAYDAGRTPDKATLDALRDVMRRPAFDVVIDLGMGTGASMVITCDLTVDYVRINADYTT